MSSEVDKIGVCCRCRLEETNFVRCSNDGSIITSSFIGLVQFFFALSQCAIITFFRGYVDYDHL